MGVEYAILHPATKEAFDLGKGIYGRWCYAEHFPPANRLLVLARVSDTYAGSPDVERQWIEQVVDAIWKFIETHPGSFVASDTGDYLWYQWPNGEPDPRDAEDFAEGYVFNEVGSIYEIGQEVHQVVCTCCHRKVRCIRVDDGTIYRPFRWTFPDEAKPLEGICFDCYQAGTVIRDRVNPG